MLRMPTIQEAGDSTHPREGHLDYKARVTFSYSHSMLSHVEVQKSADLGVQSSEAKGKLSGFGTVMCNQVYRVNRINK